MADTRTREQRRQIMQAVKTRDTAPEMLVRRLLYSLGYRYRLQAKELPGRPDIVFRGSERAIFVHGCFWHGHNCAKGRQPKSRQDYWKPKLDANTARDAAAVLALETAGWKVLVLWQCQLADSVSLAATLKTFLGGSALIGKAAGGVG